MGKTRFDWVGPGLVIGGRYRVESQLGEGGYGAVYVATQLNLGRKVALKLLHQEVLVRERARERFEREAKVTQQLSHPNIVRLFDFGTSEQGLPFIVCELLDGRSLEAELRRVGAFPVARAAHVTQQILKGLAEAHLRGIVHRDIKPANIFLCDYTGETDFVKVLDFGIATAPLEKGTAGLTQEGVSLGTPAYMSPEQVLDHPLDGRADLYSLGLVVAEMITGLPIFQGTAAMEIALKQIENAPVPLPPSIREGVLGAFIDRATQKDAAQRFGSALEMLEALRLQMAGLGIASGSAPMQALTPTGRPPSGPVAGVTTGRSPFAPAAPGVGSATPVVDVLRLGGSAPAPAQVRATPAGVGQMSATFRAPSGGTSAVAPAASPFAGAGPSMPMGHPPLGAPLPSGLVAHAQPPAAPERSRALARAEGVSSISMPIASPARGSASSGRPRYAAWAVGGLIAATALGLGTFAIVRLAVMAQKNGAPAPSSTSATPAPPKVAPGPKVADKSEEDAIDEYQRRAIAQIFSGMGAPTGCGPMPPELAKFSAQGVDLATARSRAELAGYQCLTHNKFAAEWGNMTFMGKGSESFQLHYFGPENSGIASQYPDSVRYFDPTTRRSIVVVGTDAQSSRRAADVIEGKAKK